MTAAAISAQLVDMRNVGTHKSLRLTLHVPEEYALKAIEAFGWPTGANPVPVALARLRTEASTREAASEAPARPAASRSLISPQHKMAMRAALLCKDPMFWRFLEANGIGGINEDEAAIYIRSKCDVESRSEIRPNTQAGNRFDLIQSAFIAWRDKKFVETEAAE